MVYKKQIEFELDYKICLPKLFAALLGVCLNYKYMDGQLKIIEGDITTLDVDAIVNAANESLLGGGGVDGAIHQAAGPQLLAECRALEGCLTGQAKITSGYDLPATWVIHTVGPVWIGGESGECNLLANCYKNSLKIAQQRKLSCIAFPAISTGIYRFPPSKAARIAIKTVRSFIEDNPFPNEVLFCCFNAESVKHHKHALS